MLARTAEYAVRAAVVLARHYGQGALSADAIASIVGGPRNYLSKTLNVLVRRGVLISARGPGGGFELAVPPNTLTVADIVDVFAEVRPAQRRCLLDDAPCDASHPCGAHRQWTDMTDAIRLPLLHTTIGALSGARPAGPLPTKERRHAQTSIE